MPPTPQEPKQPVQEPQEQQAQEEDITTYVVACPPSESVSVPVILNEILDQNMQPTGHYNTRSVLLQDGDTITSDMLPPGVLNKLERGDPHTTGLLYEQGSQRPETGPGINVQTDARTNPQVDQAERARRARAERAGGAAPS